MNPFLSFLAAAMFGVASIAPQSSALPAPQSGTVATPHLTLTTSSSVPGVTAGGRVSLFVEVAPKPKMHVYAPEQKTYLPVSLKLARSPGVIARPAIFPKGEQFFFAPTSETQIVYSQRFRVELPVTIAAGHPAGPLTLTATLVYQACDDRVCYVPKEVPLTWMVTVR
jgi:DsbC/DsbD-like thiol-disulfide interchange protein